MSDISVPVIDRVIELQPARVFNVDGFDYIDKDKNVTLFTPPKPTPITINTLSGLVALLENGFEGFDPTMTLVHVDAFDEVSLISKVSDIYGRRQTFVKVKALKPERPFEFNLYMTQENFVIRLLSQFVQTPELLSLIQLAGNLAAQNETRQEDDGFTQRVTAKTGVVRLAEITVSPRVKLQPFRTFLEVDQPASDFLFRVKASEQEGNKCALFEADGGFWKQNAMYTVQAWLENQLRGSSNTALNNIPVIA